MQRLLFASVIAWLAGCGEEPAAPVAFSDLEALGEELFFDQALSRDGNQSCATCHNPEAAFVDDRTGDDGRVLPVSLGDDMTSFGARNAPTASYAVLAPAFSFGTRERHNKHNQNRLYEGPLGGLFHDGRATDLAAQAGGPPLSPVEMALVDEAMAVDRLKANPRYVASFELLFGEGILSDVPRAYAAMTEAIAAFESTEQFAPFDSKYDRSLRGEATLSFKELTGKALFFSEFANCAICHQLRGNGDPIGKFEETFTGYEYHNVGTPANPEAQALSGVFEPDLGLLSREDITDPAHAGKFRTPTLRNVAVTGPYMHNGVFRDLRTVIEFYDQFNNPARTVNPETGVGWREAEVPETVAEDLLGVGDPMTDLEVESLVCFLRALTDARYEPLLENDGTRCAD